MKLHLPILLRKAVLACFTVGALYSGGAVVASDLTLGGDDSLTIDYADAGSIPDLEDGTLRLNGDTILLLSNCGEGDGKTYTLATDVSVLLDAEGNPITLDSSNNAISKYFDTNQPGTGFWADSKLELTSNGTLQLVRYMDIPILDGYTEVSVDDVSDITPHSSSDSDVAFRISQDLTIDNHSFSLKSGSSGSWCFTSESADNLKTLTFCNAKSVFSLENASKLEFVCLKGVEYIGNNGSREYGGAIYANFSTIFLCGNGSVKFNGNLASRGGAIWGRGCTIDLSENGSVEFVGNSATQGGAIYGSSDNAITFSDNGRVTFSGNTASSNGGAIYGYADNTITFSDNRSVEFIGNSASRYGGAIYGYADSTITLSDNGSVEFRGNTASNGGAIYGSCNLNIRNNGFVLFEKNAEVNDDMYRLRCIYADGSDTISLSAAAGCSIEFRDSVYIASEGTVKLNADYVDSDNTSHQQTGDIIFTGKYTEKHLNSLLETAGLARKATETELLNSRTTEVNAMTNLYGGRLCIEDGAIYRGHGITAMEDSESTVLLKDAELDHAGYQLTFHSGTTLDLYGNNRVSGMLQMNGGSTMLFHLGEQHLSSGALTLDGSLTFSGDICLQLTGFSSGVYQLLSLSGNLTGWNTENVRFLDESGNAIDAERFVWVKNNSLYFVNEEIDFPLLPTGYTSVMVDEGTDFNAYVANSSNIAFRVIGEVTVHGRTSSLMTSSAGSRFITSDSKKNRSSLTFSNAAAECLFEIASQKELDFVRLKSVTFSGNSGSSDGGAICGRVGSTITLSDNGSVEFSGNTASSYGGAIYGSTITLSGNGSVEFSENTASSSYAYGGAIKGEIITLSDNGSVTFSGNMASYRGGAIHGERITLSNNGRVEFSGNTASSSRSSACAGAIDGVVITLSGNGSVTFSGNTASTHSGAIFGSRITLSDNGSVEFIGNKSSGSGGAISGYGTITLSDNRSVEFSGNTASSSSSSYAHGGAINGEIITLSDNVSVTFSGNTASSSNDSALGGAIDVLDSITLSDNGSVEFSGNTASGISATALGGAIHGDYGSTIKLISNDSVEFIGNTASSSDSTAHGGAVYVNIGSGSVIIVGNDEVTFARNVEKSGTDYRLRSLYLIFHESTDKLTLSAGKGQSILFYDSVYMGTNGSVELNADYVDADGVTQKARGTILFSGATTEDDLKDAKGGVAGTETEIINSRTSEINSAATLYGGTLQVHDKAVLKLNGGLTVAEGSRAAVQVRAAELDLGGKALNMVGGSSLELTDGAKLTNTSLTIETDATLTVRGVTSTVKAETRVAALTMSKSMVEGVVSVRSANTGSVCVLDGDLTLESGSRVCFDGAYLELTGDLVFDVESGAEKIALEITPGIMMDDTDSLALFSVGGTVTFSMDGQPEVPDENQVYTIKASDYFIGNMLSESTTLVYDAVNKVMYLEGVANVPEPTSSMLGLVGLVALTFRRRRK